MQRPGLLLLLRPCIEKVVYHRDDDGHALHQRDMCCIGQNRQSLPQKSELIVGHSQYRER